MKTSFLRPLRLLVFFPCYAGNGGYASLSVEVMKWWIASLKKLLADPRIGAVDHFIHGDTPITMTRNQAVQKAIEGGYDLLLMVDSDMQPDCEIGRDPSAKPFLETALDFAYERLRKDLPTVIFAPYCGGGTHQNPFIFQWEELSNGSGSGPSELDTVRGLHLAPLTRAQAAELTGIVPVAAGPTGLILYTMNAFDCRASSAEGKPWFYYEMNADHTEKQSTEDVTNTRDIHLGGWEHLQADVLFCAADCWAAHIKNEHVGKPVPISNGRAAAKLLPMIERDQVEKQARLRKHLESQGVLFEDEPAAPEAEPSPAVAPAPLAVSPYPFADQRLGGSTLRVIDECVSRVLDARQRKKGDILIAYDRDLAITRLVTDALKRRQNIVGDDIRIFYSLGDGLTDREKDSVREHGPELDKETRQSGLVKPISRDSRAEGLDWDSEPTHLVIDLRTEPYGTPLAKHAYAYLSLVEPLGWRHSETIHYRQDRDVKAVWFGVNPDMLEPREDAPDERRELAGVG